MKSDIAENTHHCGEGSDYAFHALRIFNLHKDFREQREASPTKESVYYLVSLSPYFHNATLSPFFFFLEK